MQPLEKSFALLNIPKTATIQVNGYLRFRSYRSNHEDKDLGLECKRSMERATVIADGVKGVKDKVICRGPFAYKQHIKITSRLMKAGSDCVRQTTNHRLQIRQ